MPKPKSDIIECLVGHLGVDAGLMMLGDPCYIVPDDSTIRRRLAAGTGELWYKFLDQYVPDSDAGPVYHVEGDAGGALALVCRSGVGDGIYPVTARINQKDGTVYSLTITFIDDEEE